MAFNVSEVQPTPNPNAMKFVLDRVDQRPTGKFFDSLGPGSSGSVPIFLRFRVLVVCSFLEIL